MLPKVVHHKQNGHTHAPPSAPSGGDLIRTIHSAVTPAPAPTAALVRFASIVSSERAAALLADVTRRVDGVSMALNDALARTQAEIDRGGFAEVRAELHALRAHAERTMRMVNRLIGAAEQDARGTTLVDINALVAAALERLREGHDSPVAVVLRLTPGLPSVPGQPGPLLKVMQSAFAFVDHGEADAPRTFAVETTTVASALEGEPIVRIRISTSSTPPQSAADVEREDALGEAARTVAEHGGVMSLSVGAGSELVITLDLPAV